MDHDLWVTLAESEIPLVSVTNGNQAIVGNELDRQRISSSEQSCDKRLGHQATLWHQILTVLLWRFSALPVLNGVTENRFSIISDWQIKQ